MTSTKYIFAKHLAVIVGITTLLVFCMIYPFIPGGHDQLGVPLSTIVQVFGVVGLPLVLVGLLWLMMPSRGFAFAIVALTVGTAVALIIALFATLSVGNSFGILTVAIWGYVVFQQISRVKRLKEAGGSAFNPAPLYLVALPILVLFFQIALATPVTQWSRNRVIANASEFINDIEEYHAQHGRYPASLQAQNKDYYPDIVGVERYTYAPQGESYNLSFEQPRFLLDRFGTREWVVYNPCDEHRVYSHTAWRLPPSEEVEPSQGWYASGDTGRSHWKYFFFD